MQQPENTKTAKKERRLQLVSLYLQRQKRNHKRHGKILQEECTHPWTVWRCPHLFLVNNSLFLYNCLNTIKYYPILLVEEILHQLGWLKPYTRRLKPKTKLQTWSKWQSQQDAAFSPWVPLKTCEATGRLSPAATARGASSHVEIVSSEAASGKVVF